MQLLRLIYIFKNFIFFLDKKKKQQQLNYLKLTFLKLIYSTFLYKFNLSFINKFYYNYVTIIIFDDIYFLNMNLKSKFKLRKKKRLLYFFFLKLNFYLTKNHKYLDYELRIFWKNTYWFSFWLKKKKLKCLKMFERIYFFLLFLLLNNNLHININIKNFKIDNKVKKLFLNTTFNLLIELRKSYTNNPNEKDEYISNFFKNNYYNENLEADEDMEHSKSNFLNYKLDYKKNCKKKNKFKYDFLINISKINTKKNIFFFFKIFFYKKKYISLLSTFFFKKHFLKIIVLITNMSFLDYKPLINYKNHQDNIELILNKYFTFTTKKEEYDCILLCNSSLSLKTLHNLKTLDIPIIGVYDDSISDFLIDYPIYVRKVDEYTTYLFFCVYVDLFLSGQKLKKKYLNTLYLNFKKNIFLKELSIKLIIRVKKMISLVLDLNILNFIKFFITFLFLNLIFIVIYYFFSKFNIVNNSFDVFLKNNLKSILLFFISISSLFIYYFLAELCLKYYNSESLIDNRLIFKTYFCLFTIDYFNKPGLFLFTLNKFNLTFCILFSILFPIIFIIMSNDHNNTNLKIYIYIYVLFILCYLLLFIENLILFYFVYELILILVFFCMYLTSYSRGSVEATIFFAGWAILGSILVGLGLTLLIVKTNSYYFFSLNFNKLTDNETYYIYLLFFFGFGVKLSVWPFWYWLPKAHVEVSTGMSIFLSCILIKLSFFCLIRFQNLLLTENNMFICVFFCFVCSIDIIFRFLNLKDLKAIIAYSSVLHTNLLIALIHLDSFRAFKTSIYYIWGHSLATASLFIIVSLIEMKYSSRNILFVSGLWYDNQILCFLSIISIISFLDLPISVFFWGELWLWITGFNQIFLTITQVLFLVNIIFVSNFFKIWWCIFFGNPDESTKKNNSSYLSQDLIVILIFLSFIQIFMGIQPSVLNFITGVII